MILYHGSKSGLVGDTEPLFESLDRRNVDAKVFIRAFMNSRAAEGLDADYDRMQWAGGQYVFEDVMEGFNLKPDPQCPRYNLDALFYAGWIYRYWHYKTGESSREIYQQADENDILQSYGLHVESNDLAVEDLKTAAHQRMSANVGSEELGRKVKSKLL